jgi:hypothetical protein
MSNTFNCGATGANWDLAVPPPADAALMAEMLLPRFVERPPIRLPRSVRRDVSYGDLCAAADLLAKLRRRDDTRQLAATSPTVTDADGALDVAVNRLLMVL